MAGSRLSGDEREAVAFREKSDEPSQPFQIVASGGLGIIRPELIYALLGNKVGITCAAANS
jgi:hypothetical protein